MTWFKEDLANNQSHKLQDVGSNPTPATNLNIDTSIRTPPIECRHVNLDKAPFNSDVVCTNSDVAQW